jgi:hypothetical protein
VGSEYEYCPNEPKQNKKSDTFSYAHIFSQKKLATFEIENLSKVRER